VQEHERGIGGWHAEAVTIADAIQSTGSALAATADLVESLTVDPDRMRQNLAATRGVVFAERALNLLGPALGRDAAKRIVADAVATVSHGRGTFAAALFANADAAEALTPAQKAGLNNPETYLGAAETFRRALLDDHRG